MGPPIYIGGNIHPVVRAQWPRRGFNGATDLHRWKQRKNIPAPTVVLMLQWGHRFTSVETLRPVPTDVAKELASMGPPIYIGGNIVTDPETGRKVKRFNGATDLHRWKQLKEFSHCPAAISLQWGHRFTSVETVFDERGRGGSDAASMGPPIYIGGNS